ncbi:hypothetical protein [uncultured Dysgonomonas sp.]|uniref:hypothetical protein n=1 Tax=uncultured Dysgonomonas sp. TaxID=206096 RepID=UPI00260F19B7|nr:hypothetical protein [uncultured Dysgonomonas sp.]
MSIIYRQEKDSLHMAICHHAYYLVDEVLIPEDYNLLYAPDDDILFCVVHNSYGYHLADRSNDVDA